MGSQFVMLDSSTYSIPLHVTMTTEGYQAVKHKVNLLVWELDVQNKVSFQPFSKRRVRVSCLKRCMKKMISIISASIFLFYFFLFCVLLKLEDSCVSASKKGKCNHANKFSDDNLYFGVNWSIMVSLIRFAVKNVIPIISGNLHYRRGKGCEENSERWAWGRTAARQHL